MGVNVEIIRDGLKGFIPRGSIGEVRDVRDRVGGLGDKPGCRVTKGPDDDPEWTAWCRPAEIAVVTE